MPFIPIGDPSGNVLAFEIPSKRDINWADELRTKFFTVVSNHDHSGAGKGKKIGPGSLEENAVRGLTFRLENDTYARGRNAADSADINIIKVNATDLLELGAKLTKPAIEPVSADPVSPVEGELQVSDGTARPAGVYVYVNGGWVAAPSALTASNLGTGEGVFAQKVGDDVQLKSLVAGNGVDLESDTIDIVVNTGGPKVIQLDNRAFSGWTSTGAVTLSLNTVNPLSGDSDLRIDWLASDFSSIAGKAVHPIDLSGNRVAQSQQLDVEFDIELIYRTPAVFLNFVVSIYDEANSTEIASASIDIFTSPSELKIIKQRFDISGTTSTDLSLRITPGFTPGGDGSPPFPSQVTVSIANVKVEAVTVIQLGNNV